MENILTLIVRLSVGFSLFFLTLYLIASATRPITSADEPILSTGDVLAIGGMFVILGIVAQVWQTVSKFLHERKARRSSIARLDDGTAN